MYLENNWRFTPTTLGSFVDFDISFEFRSVLYKAVTDLFFKEVAEQMIGAFTKRSVEVYGPIDSKKK